MERSILERWSKLNIFQQSLELTSDGDSYVFFDGPPFATGLPHHGNLLASVIKDVIPRYWTMQGQYVERRFGWDCHGLPIEHEINKKLGMQAHEAVEELGIAAYNDECRAIVDRYTQEWRDVISRLGRWVDFDNDYKTMDSDFMESVWWVVKTLWDQGLIYRGEKVMPVSTGLSTPLSNFEASSNYIEVQDPSVTVLFKLVKEDSYLAAWTTTPWTLPSNLALCVGPNFQYTLVRDRQTNQKLYLASDRVDYFGKFHDLEVLRTVPAEHLVGQRYEPLFPYFAALTRSGSFQVFSDDYVNTEEGTGIVHQAPAFGADDYRIAQNHGLKSFVCPVTMSGIFTEEVTDFKNLFVKDADSKIIRWLKERNLLFDHRTIQHSYPYCYRSQTPLIYRAVPSWFVRIADLRSQLVDINDTIRWVPGHIRAGRMGNWLADANDWCISRNRVWGTPIPIWINDETGTVRCVGSREELLQLTGQQPMDLHREHVDDLNFELDGEPGVYRRVPEVLDCWFESGAMPYAQSHYPFENQEKFHNGFPADFIAEGLDQTRGWFYTLLVLSTLLFQKPAFNNVIVNGLVLASDGKKMSKSLKNYTDPMALMDMHGADALRLYLINSGLVRGEEQCFADSGVREMTRRTLLPWYNAYTFLALYARIDQWTPERSDYSCLALLDRWILSRVQTLKTSIEVEMDRYRLDRVVPNLLSFIDELTNWYIRLNRARFWSTGMTADKLAAYSTLHTVVFELTLAMAPCAPFLAEHIYLELAKLRNQDPEPMSVHLCAYPKPDPSFHDVQLERAIDLMQRIILLGRKQRESHKISLRTPLAEMVIIHQDHALLNEVKQLESLISRELNIKCIIYETDETVHVDWTAKPNFRILGRRLGQRMREFQLKIQDLTTAELIEFQQSGTLVLDGETFTSEDIEVLRKPKADTTVESDGKISIALNLTLTPDLVEEGIAREFVHQVQLTRKEIGLEVTDRIQLTFSGAPRLESILERHRVYIAQEVLAREIGKSDSTPFVFSSESDELHFGIVKYET